MTGFYNHLRRPVPKIPQTRKTVFIEMPTQRVFEIPPASHRVNFFHAILNVKGEKLESLDMGHGFLAV